MINDNITEYYLKNVWAALFGRFCSNSDILDKYEDIENQIQQYNTTRFYFWLYCYNRHEFPTKSKIKMKI